MPATHPSPIYLSRNNLDHTASFAVGPIHYEYFLRSNGEVDRIENTARFSSNRALNLAKRIALRVEKTP